MWAALADHECALFDQLLRDHDPQSRGCSGGCDYGVDEVHAPAADAAMGVCMLPTPAAMSCERMERPLVTHKLCPCVQSDV